MSKRKEKENLSPVSLTISCLSIDHFLLCINNNFEEKKFQTALISHMVHCFITKKCLWLTHCRGWHKNEQLKWVRIVFQKQCWVKCILNDISTGNWGAFVYGHIHRLILRLIPRQPNSTLAAERICHYRWSLLRISYWYQKDVWFWNNHSKRWRGTSKYIHKSHPTPSFQVTT